MTLVRALEPSVPSELDLGRQQRARLACRLSNGRIASNERAVEESQGVLRGGGDVQKYAVFFTLKGEAIARAMEQPSDRAVVMSKAVESAGGKRGLLLDVRSVRRVRHRGSPRFPGGSRDQPGGEQHPGPSSTWRPTN